MSAGRVLTSSQPDVPEAEFLTIRRVLHVDANDDDHALLARELRKRFDAIAIDRASDADALTRALEAETPDAVIADASLPGIGDHELVERIKSRWPDTPLILLIGPIGNEAIERAMDAGLDGCLFKSQGHFVLVPAAIRRALAHVERRERELTDARDQALETSCLKSAFLTNVSHEIRTPVNVVTGYVDLLREEIEQLPDAERLRPLLDGIRNGNDRLVRTIHGIVDLSRLETGSFEHLKRPLDLENFVREQVRAVETLASRKGLRLDLRVDARHPIIEFDEYSLAAMLSHLLDNAIKFTERGGVVVRLFRDAGGALRLDVEDTGIGMERVYLKRLFEPFSQEDSGYSRRYEGSGVGLPIVWRLARANGARLEVESEKHRGSTFSIAFDPASEVKRSDVPDTAPRPPVPRRRIRSDKSRPDVVVVEDDPDSQRLMERMLRETYRVHLAADGNELRRILGNANRGIDLILMDLSLEGAEDGVALTRWIRRHERWRDLPIIATTAHALPEDRELAVDAGCDEFLAKPFGRDRFQAVLARYLGASGTRE